MRGVSNFDRWRPTFDEKPKFFELTAVRVVVVMAAVAVVGMWLLVLLRSTCAGSPMDARTLLAAARNVGRSLNDSGLDWFIWRLTKAALAIVAILLACQDKQNKRGL